MRWATLTGLAFLLSCSPGDPEPGGVEMAGLPSVDMSAPVTVIVGDAATAGASHGMGWVATRAGDVNGDGYSDIVTTSIFEVGGTNDGRALVFHGSPTGFAASADWDHSGVGDEAFGWAATGVGDVNADDFDDLLVGAPGYTAPSAQQGRVYLFFGSSTGLSTSSDWDWVGDAAEDRAGTSLAPLGDVNGDGAADFAVGIPGSEHDTLPQDDVGAVMVVAGVSGGLPDPGLLDTVYGPEPDAGLGSLLEFVGDLDADGFHDLLSSNPDWGGNRGRVDILLGSAAGLDNPGPTMVGDAMGDRFGASLAGTGDFTGDGIPDALIGVPGWDDPPGGDVEGAVFVYYGQSSSPFLDGQGEITGGSPATMLEVGAEVGGIGDVNGDGTPEGALSRYASGSGSDYIQIVHYDGATAATVPFGDCTHVQARVSSAGDTNGDGRAELITGQYHWDPAGCLITDKAGRVQWFPSWSEGLGPSPEWPNIPAGATGDDGGAALARLDFDGDGLDDLVVGIPKGDSSQPDAGEALLYVGTSTGISNTSTAAFGGLSLASGDNFGAALAGVGDVNGDGYEDLVVGAPDADTTFAGGGLAALYLGAPSPSTVINPSGPILEGGSVDAAFGAAVAAAGDVDDDGLAEVVIGAPGHNGDGGEARVFGWSQSAMGLVSTWYVTGPVGSEMGEAVAGGDLTGDGFSDVVIGAPAHNGAGHVFIYEGAVDFETNPIPGPINLLSPMAASRFGAALAVVGDVNVDGFNDLVTGAPDHSDSIALQGQVQLWLGNTGPPSGPISAAWSTSGATAGDQLGTVVAAAGDVDSDGWADFAIGAPSASSGDGIVQLVYGGEASSLVADWTWPGMGSTGAGLAAGDFDGDGFDDLLVGSPGPGVGQVDGFPGNRDEPALPPGWPWAVRAYKPDGTPLPPGGWAGSDGEFTVHILARSPLGKIAVAPQVEVREFGVPFTGQPTHEGASVVVDPATAAPDLAIDVVGLAPDTWFHWQARVAYDPQVVPVQPWSPWILGGGPGDVLGPHVKTSNVAYGDDDDSAADDDDVGPDDDDSSGPDDDDVGPDDDDSGPDDDDVGPDDDDSGGTDEDGDSWTVEDGDCDDSNPDVHPGAVETCDGVDEDCDGAIDETGSADPDGDGYTECGANGDCAPYDPTIHPGAPELCDGIDSACDGLGPQEIDGDGDGFPPCAGDCDDDEPQAFPGATEVCGDGIDQNCDGSDADGDADGDGYLACGGDCNDTSAAAYPGAPEICDGIDNDCDGLADWVDPDTGLGEEDPDRDGWPSCGDCNPHDPTVYPGAYEACNGFDDDCDGYSLAGGELDLDGDGWRPCADDCDDHNPDVHPFQPEICGDGLDNDCNGAIDDDVDIDGDGWTTCDGDCLDVLPEGIDLPVNPADVHPDAEERCDGQDNDCNGLADDGLDADGDGYSICDCDDGDPAVHPGAAEICGDGKDNDCDPITDEEHDVDPDADGFFICTEPVDCGEGNAAVHPAAYEVCDGQDNNCDGLVDELYDADADEWLVCRFDCDDVAMTIHPTAEEICHNGIDEDCDGDPDETCPDPVRVTVPPGHACQSCDAGADAALLFPLLLFGLRRRRYGESRAARRLLRRLQGARLPSISRGTSARASPSPQRRADLVVAQGAEVGS